MKSTILTAFAVTAFALPAFADGHASGDAEAGEKEFKKCKACHMIQRADGTDIVKGGKVGPNLFGVYTRPAGSVDGFKYSISMTAAGEAGLEWNEEDFVTYVADPTAFLKGYLDDDKAKGKMAFKLKDAEQAKNVWAYLVSVGPAPE
ncbi:c-type cytochrome [Sedimentitalea todarodis]|uniref:Cytochrome C n=1 Tax=Sedimentitalea todarodis TaxID=1631240 RepID=A0ABU3VKF0_9RHOB|nr:c-type cytochrome [Sedimentitalea todarodis]MDU9006650.1 cytochrome C [Sedimentitalea todarodis]